MIVAGPATEKQHGPATGSVPRPRSREGGVVGGGRLHGEDDSRSGLGLDGTAVRTEVGDGPTRHRGRHTPVGVDDHEQHTLGLGVQPVEDARDLRGGLKVLSPTKAPKDATKDIRSLLEAGAARDLGQHGDEAVDVLDDRRVGRAARLEVLAVALDLGGEQGVEVVESLDVVAEGLELHEVLLSRAEGKKRNKGRASRGRGPRSSDDLGHDFDGLAGEVALLGHESQQSTLPQSRMTPVTAQRTEKRIMRNSRMGLDDDSGTSPDVNGQGIRTRHAGVTLLYGCVRAVGHLCGVPYQLDGQDLCWPGTRGAGGLAQQASEAGAEFGVRDDVCLPVRHDGVHRVDAGPDPVGTADAAPQNAVVDGVEEVADRRICRPTTSPGSSRVARAEEVVAKAAAGNEGYECM